MSKFEDAWDDAGGKYLPEGWHEVRVREYRLFRANSGTEGIEMIVEDHLGRTAKRGLYATERAKGILVGWCKHCGMTREESSQFDTDDLSAVGEWAVGRPLRVLVELGEPNSQGKRYNEITRSDYSQKSIPELKAKPTISEVPPEIAPSGGTDVPF